MSYQITDRVIYRTTNWTIESEGDTYYVQCQENDFDNSWCVYDEKNGQIDIHSELGQQLIEMCEIDYWEIDDNNF